MMENNKLISYHEDEDKRFRNTMAKNPAIRDPETFIVMYNGDLLNRNNPSVKEVIEEMEHIYLNLYLNGRKIVIRSEEEVLISSMTEVLDNWMVAAELKRVAEILNSEGYSAEDNVYFSKNDNPGAPLILSNDGLTKHWSSNKIAPDHDSILSNVALIPIMKMDQEQGDSLVSFSIHDLMGINLEFVFDLRRFLLEG